MSLVNNRRKPTPAIQEKIMGKTMDNAKARTRNHNLFIELSLEDPNKFRRYEYFKIKNAFSAFT